MRGILLLAAFLIPFLDGPIALAQSQASGKVSPVTPSDRAALLRLEILRDTWVSEVGAEADGNNGGASRLKLKSIQEMSLIDVDPAPLRGRVISGAWLHLKLAGDQPLQRVTVSGIGTEWFEGTGSGYERQNGAATFRHRRHPDLSWSSARPVGDLCNVVLGNGGTNWGMADASPPDAAGWQRIPIDPAVLAARVAGLSHGFLVFDDTGSEFTHEGDRFNLHVFPNRFVYSRDQNRASAPYLTVLLGATDRRPPAAPTGLSTESRDLPPGEAIVSWVTPRDQGPAGTLGFTATLAGRPVPRELIPLAGQSGNRVEMHLRDLGLERLSSASALVSIAAVDGAGNIGPAATATVRFLGKPAESLPGQPLELSHVPASTALPRLGAGEVAVIDELDKVHPKTGNLIPSQPAGYLQANHLWNAATRTISLHAARNEFVAFQILIRGRQLGGDVDLRRT